MNFGPLLVQLLCYPSKSPLMVEILPSILSADFARLADEIAKVESAGISMLHRRRHGWALRAESDAGPSGGEVDSQGDEADARCPPDDHGSGPATRRSSSKQGPIRSRYIRKPARIWTGRFG